MLLQEDKVLRDRKTLLLFIGVLTLILIFTPYLEINSKVGRKSVVGIFFQDTALEDLDAYDYIVRGHKSKDTQQQAIYLAALSTSIIAVFKTTYVLRLLPDWVKPTYYDFLFRYTLF